MPSRFIPPVKLSNALLFFFWISGLGMVDTLTRIYQVEGVRRGLYRGMSINYLRAIPMVAVSFTTYELMKQMLKLDTGIKIE